MQRCDIDCPYGFKLNYRLCKCVKAYTSVCPNYFEETYILARSGYQRQKKCACKRVSTPQCPKDYPLSKSSCKCLLKVYPPCPYGSYKRGSWCIGYKKPGCPYGGKIGPGCKCIDFEARKCKAGYLTSDKCKCYIAKAPVCNGYSYFANKCYLDLKKCRCAANTYNGETQLFLLLYGNNAI